MKDLLPPGIYSWGALFFVFILKCKTFVPGLGETDSFGFFLKSILKDGPGWQCLGQFFVCKNKVF